MQKSLIAAALVAALVVACAQVPPAATTTAAQAQSPRPRSDTPSRGQLLYDTHCIECHTQQMHWRSLKQARDWDTLKAQVRRWQGVAKLGWTEEDVEEVARHLNDTIYQFPQPQDKVISAR